MSYTRSEVNCSSATSRIGRAGRSAAWLARVFWGHEVAGSNPAAPTVEQIFPADPIALRDIRRFVREEAHRAGLGSEAAEELTLAVSEAATNSIRHTQTTSLRVEARLDRGCLVVEVEDEGTFGTEIELDDADRLGGRGIPLMTAFVDELAILEGTAQEPGTTVRLVKCRPSAAG